ncbi:MAG: orotidine 5'-phosphate decarboxylase [Thermoprotei archaeon]|nr:orotidine 5'-phosphate decarboxylase [Thermoprotei archaeon]
MKLQVALDLLNLDEAITIAEKALKGGADIIEAGTPLIKYNGMKAVKELHERFPSVPIVADMKIADVGYVEAEMAFRHGADIVTVLGLASDTTIKAAMKAAREYKGKVMADLMLVKDKLRRAKELEALGVDYILVHTGIDEQSIGLDPFEDVRNLSGKIRTPLAIAGGINDRNIIILRDLNVSIVIVGGFITKSPNPEEAVRRILRSLGDKHG